MRVFVTGASGYIGGSIAARLLASGHAVTGLARSRETAEALRRLEVEPVLGTLDDAAEIDEACRSADAVINAASSDHEGCVAACLAALSGTGKPFLHTSGSSIVADDAGGEPGDAVFEEATPFTPPPLRAPRVALDR